MRVAIDWPKRKRDHTQFALDLATRLPFTPILLEIHYPSQMNFAMAPSFYAVTQGIATPIPRKNDLKYILHLIILPNKDKVITWR